MPLFPQCLAKSLEPAGCSAHTYAKDPRCSRWFSLPQSPCVIVRNIGAVLTAFSFWTQPQPLHPRPDTLMQLLNRCLPGNCKGLLWNFSCTASMPPMPKVSWHKSVSFWSTSLGSGDSLFGASNNRDTACDPLGPHLPVLLNNGTNHANIGALTTWEKFSAWSAVWVS